MKALGLLTLSLVLLFALTACAGNRAQPVNDRPSEPATEVNEITPEPAPETPETAEEPAAGSDTGNEPGSGGVKDLGGTPVNQTQESGVFTVTIESIVKLQRSNVIEAMAGHDFVLVRVSVKNNGSEPEVISSLLHFTALVDGEDSPFSIMAGAAVGDLDSVTIDGDVDAGETLTGYYYLEPPNGARVLELMFNADFFSDSDKVTFIIDIP